MNQTGIGFAGIAGVWWLPAAQPFALPAPLAEELEQIAEAVFALFDAVTGMYGTPAGAASGLDRLLEHKLPADIPRLAAPGPALAVRPDFQLRPLGREPGYELVATELEICPSAHGFAHAMQQGYGLEPDLVSAFARLLGGRELLFVSTSEWSEFLFEQLAFCRALAAIGARARVLLDMPIAELAMRARCGECWQPPMFGIRERPPDWNTDILARIGAHGLAPFLWPDAPEWPASVGDALVFRFGYFDCFTPARLRRMREWQAAGATFLNPTTSYLASKAVLAALQLPGVRQRIAGPALATLDRCIPETRLLQPELVERLRRERAAWVVKYAGYDRGNQAWGGRSLSVGAQLAPADWERTLERCLELPWPVVAQRAVPTARVDIGYLDSDGRLQLMRQGATRLRSFMLRGAGGERAVACGTHLTVAGAAVQVSESTSAVQAPVVFHR